MRNIKAKRIVVKIGTNVLANSDGMLDIGIMQKLASQIADIKSKGNEVIIITSGAIGAGMKELQLSSKPRDVVMRQVCAGVGQSILMAEYYKLFHRYDIKIAQILLTYDVFTNKKTFTNFRNSLNKLLELGVVPIINENDPISIDEIGPSFGDNDNLSALITAKMGADLLAILTDVDGLYNKKPDKKNAVLIKEVKKIDKSIASISGKPGKLGVGGMYTKIMAAKKAAKAGAFVVIANGTKNDVLIKILSNKEIGTVFSPMHFRKP